MPGTFEPSPPTERMTSFNTLSWGGGAHAKLRQKLVRRHPVLEDHRPVHHPHRDFVPVSLMPLIPLHHLHNREPERSPSPSLLHNRQRLVAEMAVIPGDKEKL